MNNIKNMIPMGLLSIFIGKLLIWGTTPSEMGIVFALSAVTIAYEQFSKSKRIQTVERDNKEFKETILKKLEEDSKKFETIISKQNEVIKTMAEELDKTRTNVTALKMGAGLKKMGA